jgi:hypothetical protein
MLSCFIPVCLSPAAGNHKDKSKEKGCGCLRAQAQVQDNKISSGFRCMDDWAWQRMHSADFTAQVAGTVSTATRGAEATGSAQEQCLEICCWARLDG